jgi:anti-sigma regulatory factor (Ser/Thr protein kinase)
VKQNSPELRTPIRNFSLQLSATPRGARLARLLATEQLRSWGLPLDPARQVIAELSTNAATHGRTPGRDFRLLLYVVADTLRIEVTDTRADRLPTARPGLGLLLVDALADRWGVTRGLPPRKTFQTCDGCDRAFRSPTPGHCRDCRSNHANLLETA